MHNQNLPLNEILLIFPCNSAEGMRGSVSDQSQGITAGDLWHDISGKSTKLGRKFGTDQKQSARSVFSTYYTITSFFELWNCKIVRAFTYLFYPYTRWSIWSLWSLFDDKFCLVTPQYWLGSFAKLTSGILVTL